MNYVYDISEYECVGDALGKINYNFLELESQICQLSSQYFEDGFYTSFNKLSSILDNLNIVGREFASVPLYKQAYNATNLLSSYWNKNDISIIYPINLEVVPNTVYSVQNYQISSVSTDQILIQKAQNLITQKFATEDFLNITSIINVSFLIYANNGSYTPVTAGPFVAPPVMQYWNVILRKNDYHIEAIKTYKFEKIQDQWVNIGKYE